MIDLKSFDDVTAFLEATAEAYAAGSIDATQVKTRCALCAEARQTVQDKARYQEAINKLKNATKPQGLVRNEGEPIVGEPPSFRRPILGRPTA
jgi:hypothetical protein